MSAESQMVERLAAERDRFRLLFTALLMRGAEIGESPGSHRLVKIPVADVERAEGFALWEWPMVEFSVDFSVYRKGEEPKAVGADVGPRILENVEVVGLSLEEGNLTRLVVRDRDSGVTYFVPGTWEVSK